MHTIKIAVACVGYGAVVVTVSAMSCSRAEDCDRVLTCASVSGPSSDSDGGGSSSSSSVSTGPLPPCSGLPGEVPGADYDACGIFVRLEGDNGSPGTMNKPVGTLGHAVALAAEKGIMHVYACGQLFNEVVNVPAGVEVYGGLDCDNGWKPGELSTMLTAGSGAIPLRLLSGAGAEMRTKIQRFNVLASVGMKPGESSIAMLIEDVEAELVGCTIVSQYGSDGGDGEPGSIDLPVASKGQPGTEMCQALPSGGAGAEGKCGDVDVRGGDGGSSGSWVNDAWVGPTNGSAGSPPGLGGLGGEGMPYQEYQEPCLNNAKRDGKGGGDGADGAGGGSKSEGPAGTLSIEKGYEGADGQPGEEGQPGGGGGGGGGRKGTSCGKGLGAGMSGGGGGAGGCGGRGGGGGQAGGSSIALISLADGKTLTLTSTSIQAGDGGAGGQGSWGQQGAPGGAPGDRPGAADCSGGYGGDGGTGGDGGGGSAGHSIGIAYKFASLNIVVMGEPIKVGSPGVGGEGYDDAGNGVAGVAQTMAHMSN